MTMMHHLAVDVQSYWNEAEISRSAKQEDGLSSCDSHKEACSVPSVQGICAGIVRLLFA